MTKFNFEDVKGNLAAINESYTSFGSNTDYGNETIALYINNGLAPAVNSPVVGAWFSSTWAANTTSAGDFQRNFNEWSQAVTNIMVETGHTDEEAKNLYMPKLMYGNSYFFNKSAYTGNDARLMTMTEKAYRSFMRNPQNTAQLESLLEDHPESSQYVYDRVKKMVNKYIYEAEEDWFFQNPDGKNSPKGKGPQISLTGLNAFEQEMATYYNKHGKLPEASEMVTLTAGGLKSLNKKIGDREELR